MPSFFLVMSNKKTGDFSPKRKCSNLNSLSIFVQRKTLENLLWRPVRILGVDADNSRRVRRRPASVRVRNRRCRFRRARRLSTYVRQPILFPVYRYVPHRFSRRAKRGEKAVATNGRFAFDALITTNRAEATKTERIAKRSEKTHGACVSWRPNEKKSVARGRHRTTESCGACTVWSFHVYSASLSSSHTNS